MIIVFIKENKVISEKILTYFKRFFFFLMWKQDIIRKNTKTSLKMREMELQLNELQIDTKNTILNRCARNMVDM